jgi:glycerol-3-phosphate dehydrogenase
MRSVALSPAAREEALQAMADTELDVLVIGGGVVGAGSALDAATRGLSVGLVEARDFASGTSSRSSKLIHGGLRYLEMLDFRLVAEALAERGLLIESGSTRDRALRSTTRCRCCRGGRAAFPITVTSPAGVPCG